MATRRSTSGRKRRTTKKEDAPTRAERLKIVTKDERTGERKLRRPRKPSKNAHPDEKKAYLEALAELEKLERQGKQLDSKISGASKRASRKKTTKRKRR